jgi:hypothetical protein
VHIEENNFGTGAGYDLDGLLHRAGFPHDCDPRIQVGLQA